MAAIDEKKQLNYTIEECKKLISRKIYSKILVRELADELDVSFEYLSALFKRVEHVTISEYILENKIELAKDMLKNTEKSIEDISLNLGFSSQSHFGKVFKQQTGVTPNFYRRKNGTKRVMRKRLVKQQNV